MNLEALTVVTSCSIRGRSVLAALLLTAAITACTQPVPSGGGESETPASVAPNEAPASVDQPEAPATPYTAPGGY